MIVIMQDTLQQMLKSSGREKHLSAGETLFHIGDKVRFMFLIQKGSMSLQRQTTSGITMVLHVTKPGAVLAEASLYSPSYHCDAIAREPTVLHVFSKADFHSQLAENQELAEIWAKSLAMSMQEARYRAEIRTLRTVAERLDAWQSTGHVIPEKGGWQGLAVELGVTREALYRELAKSRNQQDA